MKSTYRRFTITLATLAIATAVAGCGEQKTSSQKVNDQLGRVHALTDSERPLAEANAKKYFERPWVQADNKIGQLVGCRPSDSNSNGLVTCSGLVPQANGGYSEVRRYCGYRPDLVGCSDEDTVK